MTFEPPKPPARDPLDAPVLDASDFPTGSWAPRAAPTTRPADPPVSRWPDPGKAGPTGQVPSWRGTVKTGRLVAVRPSPLGVGAAFVGALLVVLAVLLYGAVEVDVLWSVLAGVAGVGVFFFVLRGFPLFGVVALALSAFCWGLAMRAWLPGSASDVLGDLRFVGGNLALVVPLAAAFLLAIALDSHRVSRAAVEEALSGRRWWGEPEPGRGGAESRPAPLRELEALPAARFFVLAEGPCSHLVSVGRRVALVLPVAWPDGDYSVDADGRILRDGAVDAGASADLDGLVAGLDTWHQQLKDTGGTLRGFLVVSPAGPGSRVLLDVASGQHLQLVHGHEFPEAAGGWLAAEPYRIDLAVTESLLAVLGDASAAGVVPRSRSRQGQRRAGQGRRVTSRSGKIAVFEVSPDPREPSPAETAKELAPGWDSESAQQLADWGAGPPAETTEWWKGP